MKEKKTPQLEEGYTRIANELLSALCHFRIPGEIRQILDTILRKTYGYHKKSDWISNSQIIESTGLMKGNVSRGLSKLITHKIVIKSDNKLYLNKDYNAWISFSKKVIKTDTKVIKKATKVIKSDNKKLSKVRDTKDNKDNTTKDNIQKKVALYSKIEDLLESDLEYIANHYKVPLAFVLSKKEDMYLWANEKAGRGKGRNWKLTLMNWVKRDALQITEKYHDKKRYTDKYKVTEV